MSQDGVEEDVKPKLTLNIQYDGQTVTVKVKGNMRFSKIFDVVEKKFQKDPGTFKFVFEGQRIGAEDTPSSLGMEDKDQIDAFLTQVGGGNPTKSS